MASLQDFINRYINGGADHSHAVVTENINDPSMLGRLDHLGNRAWGSAEVDEFGRFTGRRSGVRADNLTEELDHFRELKNQLTEDKAEGLSGRSVRSGERSVEQQKKRLERLGKDVFRDIDEATVRHNDVIRAARDQERTILEQVQRAYDREANILNTRLNGLVGPARDAVMEERELLRTNHEAVRRHISDQFDQANRFHKDQLEEFKGIISDIEEHTGLKSAEHMPRSQAAAAATEKAVAKEAGAAEHAAGGAKPSHFGMTAGGAAAGAVIGYVASDDENKAKNTVIGGFIGGGLGNLLSRFTKKTTQLGGALAGAEAKGLLSQMGQAATHLHR